MKQKTSTNGDKKLIEEKLSTRDTRARMIFQNLKQYKVREGIKMA